MSIVISGTDGISPLKATNGSAAAPSVTGTDTDTGLFFGTNEVNIATGGTERVKVDSSGRLLVGTSSSSATVNALFQDNSSSTGPGHVLISTISTVPTSAEALGRLRFSAANHVEAVQIEASRDGGTWTAGSSQPSKLVFSTTADGASSPTERMRIANDGKVRINRTSGLFTEQFLVESDTTTVNPMTVSNTRATAATDYAIIFGRAGSIVGSVQTSLSATVYATSSDHRLKENIAPVADGITRLQQLKPCQFNFIAEPDTTVDGFLAHEVQDVVPEAVTGTKDAVDDEGNPEYQGIDQSKLVPLLTAALQEAIAKIETLEAKVAALEGGAS